MSSSTNRRVLRRGSYGVEVKELRQRLFDLGLFTRKSQIDGDFGGKLLTL